MTPANIRRLSTVLEEFSKLHPQWRVGQIVANVSSWARGPASEAVWDVEDEEFLKAAEEHIRSAAQAPTAKAS